MRYMCREAAKYSWALAVSVVNGSEMRHEKHWQIAGLNWPACAGGDVDHWRRSSFEVVEFHLKSALARTAVSLPLA
jgi:hypothetical protein